MARLRGHRRKTRRCDTYNFSGAGADAGQSRRYVGASLEGEIMSRLPLTVAFLVASLAPAIAQDIDAGERSFRKCTPCHSIGPNAQNKLGPILNGLDGRKSGTIEGYNYTEANKNSGIIWDDTTFSEYIIDPRAKIPNTKMIFPGIKNEKERGDLWAYIKQFDKDGVAKK
jgi:cytochrome c